MSERELDAAGIVDPELRDVYRATSTLFRKYAGGNYLARFLFPEPKRPYLDAFFLFVLYLDDIVDNPDHSIAVRDRRLDEWQAAFNAAVAGEPRAAARGSRQAKDEKDDEALARGFVHVLRTWGLPLAAVPSYLDGQRAALVTTEYETVEQFDEFVDAVILLPAVWVNEIFEPQSPEAVQLCRHTISGFSLLDMLWDIKEDLAGGRLYLPLEHLRKFGLERPDLEEQLASGRLSGALREFIRFEIERGKEHLRLGKKWPELLHPTSRTFMRLDMTRFDIVGTELEKDDCAYFARPQRKDGLNRARIMPYLVRALATASMVNRRAIRSGYQLPVRPAPTGELVP